MVNKSCSSDKEVVAGVPQGSVLGSILFLLYVYDFPRHKKTEFTMFADDTSIRSCDENPPTATYYLQQHLNILHPYYEKLKIRVNAIKSEFKCFTRSRQAPNLQLTFNNMQVPQRKSVKYLGIHLQSNMKFNLHISETLRKARNVASRLSKLINPCSKLSAINKLTVYK